MDRRPLYPPGPLSPTRGERGRPRGRRLWGAVRSPLLPWWEKGQGVEGASAAAIPFFLQDCREYTGGRSVEKAMSLVGHSGSGVSRRRFLAGLGTTLAVSLGTGLIVSCGGSTTAPSPTSAPATQPTAAPPTAAPASATPAAAQSTATVAPAAAAATSTPIVNPTIAA